MLLELVVENYAVVERVRVRFHAGLNLLTGETGSGKSIVVDALGLVLGGRASADMVRSDAERARVAAIFEAPTDAGLAGLAGGGGRAGGGWRVADRARGSGRRQVARFSRKSACDHGAACARSRRFWATSTASTNSSSYFRARRSYCLLDDFARVGAQRDDVGGLFRSWKSIEGELEELNRSEQEKLRMADLWSFQRKEIDAAGFEAGRRRATGATSEWCCATSRSSRRTPMRPTRRCMKQQESVSAQIRVALKKVEELARIDASLQRVVETLQSAAIGVDEASDAIRDYLDTSGGGSEAAG